MYIYYAYQQAVCQHCKREWKFSEYERACGLHRIRQDYYTGKITACQYIVQALHYRDGDYGLKRILQECRQNKKA